MMSSFGVSVIDKQKQNTNFYAQSSGKSATLSR
jgi:hypothetical protein